MDWLPIIAALTVVLSIIYYRLSRIYDFFEKAGIPYHKPVFLLGSIWKAVLQQVTFAEALQEIYNVNREAKYLGFFDFTKPVVAIRDLDLIKSITIKHFEHFPNHRSFLAESETLFSKNLFSLRDDRWKEVRNMLSPAFTSSKMKAMFVLMGNCAKVYGDYLVSLPKDQRTLELKDAFTRYTNDVIATCAFGVEVNSMKDQNNKFYVYGREATSFGRWQSFKFFLVRSMPWLMDLLNVKLVDKKIADFFHELVATTIKTRDEKGIVRPDVIQLMMESRGKMESGKELTIEDMTAQAFVFFFGGFESTSTLMCFAAYEVGVNEDVQKRLQEEIDQVLEDCKGEVTYEAVNDMKYLEAIIYEALRLYPAIVASDRVCSKPFELPPALPGLKPYVVQEGDIMWLPIYGIQRDSRYYPEPDKFDPDRFDDVKAVVNSSMYLSFGLGPRMCIGNRFALLETKVLLFHLFAKCNLKPCSKTIIPMRLSKKGFSMTADTGFWFDIEPRKEVNSVCSNGVVH